MRSVSQVRRSWPWPPCSDRCRDCGGDMVLLVAMYGLPVLAELMGGHFALMKYFGGAYLAVLGMVLRR